MQVTSDLVARQAGDLASGPDRRSRWALSGGSKAAGPALPAAALRVRDVSELLKAINVGVGVFAMNQSLMLSAGPDSP